MSTVGKTDGNDFKSTLRQWEATGLMPLKEGDKKVEVVVGTRLRSNSTSSPLTQKNTPPKPRRETDSSHTLRRLKSAEESAPESSQVNEDGTLEKTKQRRTPPSPSKTEHLETKSREGHSKCQNELKTIEQIALAYLNFQNKGEQGAGSFAAALALTKMETELRLARMNAFEELQTLLIVTDTEQTYVNACKEQERLVTELCGKIEEFLSKMEALKSALQDPQTKLKIKEEVKEEMKQGLLNAVETFFSVVNAELLKKKLNDFKLFLHTDFDSVMSAGDALKTYFEAVKKLIKSYITIVGYTSNFEIYKQRKSLSVTIHNREGKETNYNAKDLLPIIPRELSQYTSYCIDLEKHSKTIVGRRESAHLPHDIESCMSHIINLKEFLKSAQEEINRLTLLNASYDQLLVVSQQYDQLTTTQQ